MCKLIAAESKLFPCRKYLKKFILLPILPQHWPQLMSFLVFSRLNVVANILEPWPVYLDWSDPDDWSPWSMVWIQHQETTNISNSWSYYFENFILQFHEIFHEKFYNMKLLPPIQLCVLRLSYVVKDFVLFPILLLIFELYHQQKAE